ncbi:hypothetical protein [uncultured Bradyrhizobium sp.]|mgnify:CR=1 FL=1|uniref:hypothetical protein n=1 Tax=uncultured Bradyrhizobium sp. TaxID=199684 RepID=UPI00261909A3|nr:hypothetical protein [uncultured Bradyrhizobium sp.]
MIALIWAFDAVWWLIGYSIARVLLPIVSSGKIQVSPFLDSRKFNWLGYRYSDDGRVEIEATLATLIGLLCFCAGLMTILFLVR